MLRRPGLTSCSQCGAGLIEVAISLLLLAVGTLGLGSLQISAKRMGYEAIQRQEAAALAMDLLERLRANRVALAAYGTAGIGAGSGARPPDPPTDCYQGSCSAAEMNAWDMFQWQQALDGVGTSGQAGGLLRPTACVTVSGRSVTVAIAWEGYRPLLGPLQEGICGAGNYGADDADRQWLQMTSWIGQE
jgi:type IV pilus assembly protein PilV